MPQPALDGLGPHLSQFPPGIYERTLSAPDAAIWNSVDHQPPVKNATL